MPSTAEATRHAASRLKQWAAMPPEFFETLTFGDLRVGQSFICLPTPGDNHGHGGFKDVHTVFVKTVGNVSDIKGIPYGVPHGRATSQMRTVLSDFPLSMPVICVK